MEMFMTMASISSFIQGGVSQAAAWGGSLGSSVVNASSSVFKSSPASVHVPTPPLNMMVGGFVVGASLGALHTMSASETGWTLKAIKVIVAAGAVFSAYKAFEICSLTAASTSENLILLASLGAGFLGAITLQAPVHLPAAMPMVAMPPEDETADLD